MKHKKLLIVILVCVIVFISSTTAGIVLAANSIEWSKISLSELMNGEFGGLFEVDGLSGLFRGNRINRTIDQSFSLDLDGIETIKITGVAEKLEIGRASGNQVDCRLSGEYYTALREMTYIYEKNGSQLHIHPDYPVFGFINVNLIQRVLIPADFDGKVELGTVSGSCTVDEIKDAGWSSLSYQGVSGSLDCKPVSADQIRFNSVSGRINIDGYTGRVEGETVSGSVTIGWQSFAGGNLSTISGDISLQIPADASCELQFDTVSGHVNNQGLAFEMTSSSGKESTYILNGGEYSLEIDTISGSLKTSPTP